MKFKRPLPRRMDAGPGRPWNRAKLVEKLWIILCLLCAACAAKPQWPKNAEVLPQQGDPPVWAQHPIVAHCMIFDSSGALLWSYPARLCVFLADGRFITGDPGKIALHGQNLGVIWQRSLDSHHMVSLAGNGDILLLSSEMKDMSEISPSISKFIEHFGPNRGDNITPAIPKAYRHGQFRIDKLIRLDMSGHIVAERLAGETYPLNKLVADSSVLGPARTPEVSHCNTIYEIPPNTSALAAFRAGNILVSDNMNRVMFVLDKDLKKNLWQRQFRDFGYLQVHDVHVLANGHLLLLKNRSLDNSEDSSLEEIDPVRNEVVWKYTERPAGSFRADTQGSVQPLRGGYVLFANTTGNKSLAKIIDRAGAPVWSLDLSRHFDILVQGVYQLPAEDFLRNNHPD